LAIAALLLTVVSCGYSEEQWQAQLDKYAQLAARNQASEGQLAQVQQELAATKDRVAKLEADLMAAGVDMTKLHRDLESRSTEISKLSVTLEEQQKALAEYKARAAQLERIKQRFEQLRRKLNELTRFGLAVSIRRNRMIISLPGDVLFASGRDTLTRDGEEILRKVAAVIQGDPSLLSREYQITGHTDNKPLRGGPPFYDNWGLSLMRARRVLLFLIDPDEGGMPVARWSAAGFADTDPVASNEDADGRQKNRRCELIVVPSAEEMLDLQNIAK